MTNSMKNRALGLIAAGAIGGAAGAAASDYQDAWGPPVGAMLPAIAAQDQHGAERSFANLTGERGLALFVVRSADW